MGLKAFNKEKEFSKLNKKSKTLIILSTSLACLAILTIFLYQSFASFVDTKTHNFINVTVSNFGPCEGEDCGVLSVAESNVSANSKFLGTALQRNQIEELVFTNTVKVPTDLVATSADVSHVKNNSVKAWWEPVGNNGRYKVTIGAKDGVKAWENAYFQFAYLVNLDRIDLTHFYLNGTRDIAGMFKSTGYNSTKFTLDVGPNFNTSNVEDMTSAFEDVGYSSPVFTVNFGNNFYNNQVSQAASAFRNMGYSSEIMTLNLGTNFDVLNTEDLSYLFSNAGKNSEVFTFTAPNFDFYNTKNMSYMFEGLGGKNPNFTFNFAALELYPAIAENMDGMFKNAGYYSSRFEINLGNTFKNDVPESPTSMREMFAGAGYSNPNFKVEIPQLFIDSTNDVTDMFKGGPANMKIYVNDAAAKSRISGSSGLPSGTTIYN